MLRFAAYYLAFHPVAVKILCSESLLEQILDRRMPFVGSPIIWDGPGTL